MKHNTEHDQKAFFYETFAPNWDERMCRDEIDKRLRLVFSQLLTEADVRAKRVLDVGSGMGYFSRGFADWGAQLVALDMGQQLLTKVREKCAAETVVGTVLDLPFRDGSFDLVFCTEVIEHTTDPRRAVAELCRTVAPGAILVLTVPNRLWHPAVVVANALHLRPYLGYENWVAYRDLARWVADGGLQVEQQSGFNLLPHTFFCRKDFDCLDRFTWLHPFMINIAIRARKR